MQRANFQYEKIMNLERQGKINFTLFSPSVLLFGGVKTEGRSRILSSRTMNQDNLMEKNWIRSCEIHTLFYNFFVFLEFEGAQYRYESIATRRSCGC